MVYKLATILFLSTVLACGSQSPLSPDDPVGSGFLPSDAMVQPANWQEQLQYYQLQIDLVLQESKGSDDFASLYGGGSGSVSGDGTFIGEGNGLADLQGVGIVTGELTGTARIKGTEDINARGLDYVGTHNGYQEYDGAGYLTVTSDQAQEIEVIIDGDGWVIGAGTGIVLWSGEGWNFWYH